MIRRISIVAVTVTSLATAVGCTTDELKEWVYDSLNPPFAFEKDKYAPVSLDDLSQDGKRWANVMVQFQCKLNRLEDPPNLKLWTSLPGADYLSFSAFDASRNLAAEGPEPKGAYPLLFVAKEPDLASGENRPRGRLLKALEKARKGETDRYPLISIKGRVVDSYRNVSWVLADDIREVNVVKTPAGTSQAFDSGKREAARGEFAAADKDFRQALATKPPDGTKVEILRERGLVQLNLGRPDLAEKDLSRVSEWGMADANALIGLAEAKLRMGRATEAESALSMPALAEIPEAKDLKAACSLFLNKGAGERPTSIRALDALGEALIRSDKAAEAIPMLLHARLASKEVPNSLVEYHLAKAYALSGDKDRAKGALDRVKDTEGPIADNARSLRESL